MKLNLTFLKDGEACMNFPLDKNRVYVGRGSDCDVSLADPEISRRHLVFTQQSDGYVVTDQSTNGSKINGEPLQSKSIQPGDQIHFGNWTAEVSELVEQDVTNTQVRVQDATEVLSFDVDQQALVVEKAYLIPMGGAKDEVPHPITKDVFTIGKSAESSYVLNDEFASTHHCKLLRRGRKFFVKDLQSTNGTYIDDTQVFESELIDGAILECGQSKFRFSLDRSSQDIEPLNANIFEGMVTQSETMQKMFSLIKNVGPSNVPVLIKGETGTGKELIAKALHKWSGLDEKTFFAINCGAISKDLIESELFGHEKGAFTSAHQQRKGLFEQADGGTLFLDEIGELPIDLQPKLLRVLETGEIRRVGGSNTISVNVRLLAATHRDLLDEIQNGRFREDLFHRIYVVPIDVPALRARREDIPSLCDHFLALQQGSSSQAKTLSPDAIEKLLAHHWPGNVRELRNVISRAFILSQDAKEISPDKIEFPTSDNRDRTAFAADLGEMGLSAAPRSLKELEKDRIVVELRRAKGNRTQAAKSLGIAKSTLLQKIKKYKIPD